MGQDRVRHVMMPTPPGARFVMIHPPFSFGFFQPRLPRPAQTTHAHQFVRRTTDGGIAEIELHFRLPPKRPPEDGPTAWPGQLIADRGYTHESKLGEQRAFTAFFNNAALPQGTRQL